MKNSNTMYTFYVLLNIKYKIPNERMRLLYLRDVWGLEQTVIGDIEKKSQSYISRELLVARKLINPTQFKNATTFLFTSEEIQTIQFLPRVMIKDVPCLAFLNNILGIEVYHPFFQHFDHNENLRIAALASIGVQNKHLVKIFGKTQPTVSMITKRHTERAVTLERSNRYEQVQEYKLKQKTNTNNFLVVGGSI